MSKALSQLLEKEVTRKEFLQFLAAAIIALFGLNNFISLLTSYSRNATATQTIDDANRHGFGSSKFGA